MTKTAFGDDTVRNAALPDPQRLANAPDRAVGNVDGVVVTFQVEPPDYSCCCTALSHDHLWGALCGRRATFAGGICIDCRYFHTFPERRENL